MQVILGDGLFLLTCERDHAKVSGIGSLVAALDRLHCGNANKPIEQDCTHNRKIINSQLSNDTTRENDSFVPDLICLISTSAPANEPAKLTKALVDAVESRRKAKTIQLNSETVVRNGGRVLTEIKRQIWDDIDANMLRCDVRKNKFDGQEIDTGTAVLCFECNRREYLTRYSKNKDGVHTSVIFDKPTDKNADRILHRIDWQGFGLFGRSAKDCRSDFTNEIIKTLKLRIAASGSSFSVSGGVFD